MSVQQLATLITSRHRIIEHLHLLVQRQLEVVRSGDVTRLLESLGRKQYLLFEIEQIERQLDPYRHEEPELRIWPNPQTRTETQETIEESKRLLAEIHTIDEECMEELEKQKNTAERQTRKLETGSQVATAYTRHARHVG